MGKLQHKISLYTLVCTFLQMGASSWTDDMYLQPQIPQKVRTQLSIWRQLHFSPQIILVLANESWCKWSTVFPPKRLKQRICVEQQEVQLSSNTWNKHSEWLPHHSHLFKVWLALFYLRQSQRSLLLHWFNWTWLENKRHQLFNICKC